MTNRIYEIDSFVFEYESKVVSVEKADNLYGIILDNSPIFPGGGGQPADKAFIDGHEVLNGCQEGDRDILYIDSPLNAGDRVRCSVDREVRIRRLQAHSGEHILSGTVHTMFGYDNVGFHMDEDALMTIDFSGELKPEDLKEVEKRANEHIFESHAIRCWFPNEEELKNLKYRSKKELTGKIRIVSIEGCDDCACCAPHLKNTSQVGIIKILSHMRWRGGSRITVKCGFSALDDYNVKIENCKYIGEYLAVKQNETAEGFKKYSDTFGELKKEITELKKQNIVLKAESVQPGQKNIVVFDDNLEPDDMRYLANTLSDKASVAVAVFSKTGSTMKYLIKSCGEVHLKTRVREINDAIKGHGGGSEQMISGVCEADEAAIREYFSTFQ